MKKFMKWAIVLSVAILGTTACSKSDDVEEPTTADVIGLYDGKMDIEGGEPTPVKEESALTAEVKADTMIYKNFPIRPIVTSIVGVEAADAIVAAIGELNYSLSYAPTMNAAKDSVIMNCKPAPLVVLFPSAVEGADPDTIKVTVVAPGADAYSIASSKLNTKLNATAVTINGNPLETFKEVKLLFDFTKK